MQRIEENGKTKTYNEIVLSRMASEGGKYLLIYLFVIVPVLAFFLDSIHSHASLFTYLFSGVLVIFLATVAIFFVPWHALFLILFLFSYFYIACINYKSIRLVLYITVLAAWTVYSPYFLSKF